MPTGYTSIISEKDISFKEFALRCARAFGACSEQRDDDINDPPKPRVYDPNNYFERVLKEGAPDLSFDAFVEKGQQEIAEYEKIVKERREVKQRYEKLLREVSSWTPPTQEHEELKSFMLKQLNDSMRCDCDTEFCEKEIKKLNNTKYSDWKKEKLEQHRFRVERTQIEIAKCKKSIEEANKWLEDLNKSL